MQCNTENNFYGQIQPINLTITHAHVSQINVKYLLLRRIKDVVKINKPHILLFAVHLFTLTFVDVDKLKVY